MSEEISFDIDEKSIKNIKEAMGLDEIKARHQRFMNGTETIDDLINHIYHYKIKNNNGLDLDVVEKKYYEKIVDLYNKEKDYAMGLYYDVQGLQQDLDKEKEKNKELEEYANWHIEHLTEDIEDYIDDDRKGNASIIGEFKEEREHWKDIIRIINKEKTYIDYKNY